MASITTNFPPDLIITAKRGGWTNNFQFLTRLIANGASTAKLISSSIAAESTSSADCPAFVDNVSYNNNTGTSTTGNYVGYAFRRAPGFFDVVCYTGTGSATTQAHNLGVVPELMIVKRRNSGGSWFVYNQTTSATKVLFIDLTDSATTFSAAWNNTAPTSSVFTVGNDTSVNASGSTYIAYLFASCPGVSKVGSYTGNGSSQTINCGFTNGARFVLIKRTNASGDWYVWDTARGIVASNDPHLSLNSTAAEVTTNDTIDPNSTGFIVNQVAATNVNVSGGSYIYLAIA